MKQGFFILFSALTLFSCTNVQKPTPTLITLQNCHSFKGTFVYKNANDGAIFRVNSCNFTTGIYVKMNVDHLDFGNGTGSPNFTSGLPSDTLFVTAFFNNGFLVKTLKKQSFDQTYELRDSCSSSLMSIDTQSVYSLLDYSIE